MNTVSISCINPECGKSFPLRYRSKNVERRGMYCSRKCYGHFTPKMNDVYAEWLKRMPAYESLRPREFMAVLLIELNRIHGTWTRRAQVLKVSRLSFMHWVAKLKPELEKVGKAFSQARGDAKKVVEILNGAKTVA
jgi:hypothetical protein